MCKEQTEGEDSEWPGPATQPLFQIPHSNQRCWGPLVTPGHTCILHVSENHQPPCPAPGGLLVSQPSLRIAAGGLPGLVPLHPQPQAKGRTWPHYSLSALTLGQLHVILHPETMTGAQGVVGVPMPPQTLVVAGLRRLVHHRLWGIPTQCPELGPSALSQAEPWPRQGTAETPTFGGCTDLTLTISAGVPTKPPMKPGATDPRAHM